VTRPCRQPRTTRQSLLGAALIMVIGLIAVIIAVFGHPTQTVAAAVIVTALGALAGGDLPPGGGKVLESLTRFLPSIGRSALEQMTPPGEETSTPDQSSDHNDEPGK
jgi:hypothetical protein